MPDFLFPVRIFHEYGVYYPTSEEQHTKADDSRQIEYWMIAERSAIDSHSIEHHTQNNTS